MDLQPGKYCIVPCIANLEGKDARFLLRVLVEPHGFLKSWKKFEVTQNCTRVQPNGTCSSDLKAIAKPKLENSTCTNFPNCRQSKEAIDTAYIFNFKCGVEVVTYDTKMWHEKCFSCHKCHKDLNKMTFHFYERNVFCEYCHTNHCCKKCAACQEPILGTNTFSLTLCNTMYDYYAKFSGASIIADGESFHKSCFTCSNCQNELGSFYTIDGKRYCENCKDVNKNPTGSPNEIPNGSPKGYLTELSARVGKRRTSQAS